MPAHWNEGSGSVSRLARGKGLRFYRYPGIGRLVSAISTSKYHRFGTIGSSVKGGLLPEYRGASLSPHMEKRGDGEHGQAERPTRKGKGERYQHREGRSGSSRPEATSLEAEGLSQLWWRPIPRRGGVYLFVVRQEAVVSEPRASVAYASDERPWSRFASYLSRDLGPLVNCLEYLSRLHAITDGVNLRVRTFHGLGKPSI